MEDVAFSLRPSSSFHRKLDRDSSQKPFLRKLKAVFVYVKNSVWVSKDLIKNEIPAKAAIIGDKRLVKRGIIRQNDFNWKTHKSDVYSKAEINDP